MATSKMRGGIEPFSLTRQTAAITAWNTNCRYDHSSQIVTIDFDCEGTDISWTLFSVPEKYRPTEVTRGIGVIRATSGQVFPSYITVGTQGNITQAIASSITYANGHIEYIKNVEVGG